MAFSDGEAPSKKHVLLMDEVDGMSGNEDRGGMQELIALIKKSMIPVICMCNDRYNQKIASLSNYCLDLRFTKPRMEQIRVRLDFRFFFLVSPPIQWRPIMYLA